MINTFYCWECDREVPQDPNGKLWRYAVDLQCGHTIHRPEEEWD